MGTRWTLAAGAVAALAALPACSPYGGGAFACDEDSQCGVDGTCEANHLCSFPDVVCGSGRRYGDSAGDLSGICVGDEPAVDAPSSIDSPNQIIDAPPGSPDATCIVDGLDLCAENPPDSGITFGDETLDTGNDPRCRDLAQPGGGEHVCLIYASAISVSAGATLIVIGDRPLALAASGLLVVDGVIDAGSTVGGRTGPDADGSCPGFPTNPKNDGGGAGGGAGASFATAGGNGGLGDSDNSSGSPGNAPGGTRNPMTPLTAFVRGGCRGQDGGDEGGGGGGNGGARGSSGGAVWLLSIVGVQISGGGGVSVTGAGGEGGETQSGGGGAGSGGMIRIAAPQIAIAGTVAANGGGGGGGGGRIIVGGNGIDINGTDGSNGPLADIGGPGGAGAVYMGTEFGGRGGTGASLTLGDGAVGGPSVVGAGGGGGGAGFIVLTGTPTISGTVSPAPIVN